MDSTRLTDEERKRQISFKKRKTGILKKAEQLRRLFGVEIALFIYDKNPPQYFTYHTSKSFKPTLEHIERDEVPSESIAPNDFITDDESDGQITQRQRIPDIRLKAVTPTSSVGKRQRTTRYDGSNKESSTKRTKIRVQPPPALPSLIRDLAHQRDSNDP